jgi:hypothetical protein
MKAVAYLFLIAGLATTVFAGTPSPEIDPGTACSAFLLIGGATLVVRSRRKVN